MSINNLSKKTIKLLENRVKPYKLISKRTGLNPNYIRTLPEQLSTKEAYFVDIIVVASSENTQKQKIITTYKDKNGEIIEKIFEYNGFDKPTIHKIYKNLETYSDNIKAKLIQTVENISKTKGFSAWKKIKTEKQIITKKGNQNIEEITTASVSTNERFINETKNETHTFKKYVFSKNKEGIKTKTLKLETEKNEFGIPIIKNIENINCTTPQNDEYLALRAYDYEDIRIPMAKIALKKLGLENLRIKIDSFLSRDKKIMGSFDHYTGMIKFNHFIDLKLENINTAFHEAKHALQYAIMGIFEKIQTQFGKKCFKEFKGTKTPELNLKAINYFVAHTNYVPSAKNKEEYLTNILEKEAYKAGDLGLNDYIQKGDEIYRAFDKFIDL